MPRYAINICEDTLDLIQFLNSGAIPEKEKHKDYFLFTVTLSATIEKPQFLSTAQFYRLQDAERWPDTTWIKELIG